MVASCWFLVDGRAVAEGKKREEGVFSNATGIKECLSLLDGRRLLTAVSAAPVEPELHQADEGQGRGRVDDDLG